MPQIKAFKGIHPSADTAARVVLPLESLSISQAKAIVKENPLSFANMLVPEIDNPYLRGSKKELAYKKINENFDDFLEKGILIKDEKPAVYIYRTIQEGLVQTGIWTVTAIDDYLNNTVRKHELTRADREKNLIEYLQQTGIDANPVLIAHPPNQALKAMVGSLTGQKPVLDFYLSNARHILWQIDAETEVAALVTLFSELGTAYIADGHHRAAAACTAGIERRKLNLKHRGDEEYNFFSTVYIAADELKILEFNRLIKAAGGLEPEKFLQKLSQSFNVQKSGIPVKPVEPHHFGMYLKNIWYTLVAKPQVSGSAHPVKKLDVSILQDYVLQPVLGISDARTDARISFIGGATAAERLSEMADKGQFDIVFTLCPTSIEQLFAVADAGEVMPPKSTWFEPKFLAGLLVHEVG